MHVKLANNSTISFNDLEKAHYQLFELLVYFLTQHPGQTAAIRNAIVNNDIRSLPENTISFMKEKHFLDKKNKINEAIKNVCESYISSDGSFNKTFLKKKNSI